MSAVILAVIVIMWAVVLVPMWLRRHEAATENRSVDRFPSAMRVLSRRQPRTPAQSYVVLPRRHAPPSVHVSGAAPASAGAGRRPMTARPAPSSPPGPRTKPSAATRRRRAVLGLVAVVSMTMLLATLGVIGWPLQIVVDLVLVAFVAHLRREAKRAAAARRARRAAAAPVAPAPAWPSYARGPRRAPQWAPTAQVASSGADVAGESGTAAATGTDGRRDEWEPVPVPPPTYTMKPRAPQHWTYEAPAADVAEVVESGSPQAPIESPDVVTRETAELDEILDRPWAVND